MNLTHYSPLKKVFTLDDSHIYEEANLFIYNANRNKLKALHLNKPTIIFQLIGFNISCV